MVPRATTTTAPAQVLAGRYLVGEVIGRGGMADVRAGHDIRTGRSADAQGAPYIVMVTASGTVKLVDFGIARASGDPTAIVTHAQEFLGTPAFFSPEQARGQTTDARSDLYSAGCLLFEDPEERFQSAGAFQNALRCATEVGPGTTSPTRPALQHHHHPWAAPA